MSDYLLTVDVEDWFHTHNLQPGVGRETWSQRESRVGQNVDRLLEAFERHGASGTFFVLGWVADHHPEVVGAIADAGHEIACHGYGHRLVTEQSPADFRADVERGRSAIEAVTDASVEGYRAPSFSITDRAIDELADMGFRYDSSLFRSSLHDRYGSIEAPAGERVFEVRPGLYEVELPVLSVAGLRLPWGGGAYFRVLPYRLFCAGLRRLDGPATFYLHPWEIDPDQPRIEGVPYTNRLRHYANLDRTDGRLERLLTDFEWSPVRAALP